MGRKTPILWISLGIVAIVIAAVLDRATAAYVRESGIERFMRTHDPLTEVLKAPGTYWFAVVCAAVVLLIRKPKWHDAAFVALAPLVSGLNGATKWILGRHRPYTWGKQKIDELRPFDFAFFRGGIKGMFNGTNLSFPSGHACMAFATATALAILFPRWKWLFFAVASVTAIERVTESAHWFSDCVAAIILGVGGVHLVHFVWVKMVEKKNQMSA
jgi:membrane-associated phospholipid phosphatase